MGGLEIADNTVHREELIPGQPQRQIGLRHTLESGQALHVLSVGAEPSHIRVVIGWERHERRSTRRHRQGDHTEDHKQREKTAHDVLQG